MADFLFMLLDVAVTIVKLCRPGGVRAVIAENLLLKQQLLVLRRGRRRVPRLTGRDRFVFGFTSLFLSVSRIRNAAIALRPSTLLAFHQALVRHKYRGLFSSALGGHPKAAINRHPKTGHFLNAVDRDVDRDEEHVILGRHGTRLGYTPTAASRRARAAGMAAPAH